MIEKIDIPPEFEKFSEECDVEVVRVLRIIESELAKINNGHKIASVVGSLILNLTEGHYTTLLRFIDGENIILLHMQMLKGQLIKWSNFLEERNKNQIH